MRLLARTTWVFPAATFWIYALLISAFAGPSCKAQTQQPFLFAGEASNGQVTGFAVFVRNDQTGDLSEVAGSPFTSLHSGTCMMTVVDAKGRFLYGPCGLGASMYTLDATTGAVAEVAGSPFAGSTDTRLGSVATESTGQYVYILKFSFNNTSASVILDTLQVDPVNEQLVAQSSQTIQLPGTIVSEAASPHGFYLLLNDSQSGSSYPAAVLYAILFDATTGVASTPQLLEETSNNARSMMMDAAGKNLVISAGQDSGSLWFLQLSPTDGTVSAMNTVSLAFQEFATPIAFDPTSSFFYLQFEGTGATESGIRIFSVATQTETASSPVPASLTNELGGAPDPQGPFSYFGGLAAGGISVFGVDLTTGYPVSPSGFTNPLFPGRDLGPGPATIDLNTQPVQAPAAGLNAASLSFGSVNVGQTSPSQSVTLTNTGSLALSLTSIQVTGTNAADFTESDTCMSSPQLQPNKSCIISVTYHPSAAGAGSATVLVTDNASGSPQQIALSGTGVSQPPPAAGPAVTLNPNPLSFAGTVTEGTLSAPQNVALTNSGNATLHVQTIVLGGSNSGDFTISANSCVGSVAANASCQLSVTFAPLGPGVRSASLTITDDAANSPQTLNIVGTGGTAAQIASVSGSTTVTVNAGQSAQFNLQITPAAGFSGSFSFTCAGTPTAANCSVPSSVAVSGGTAANFTVTVATSGTSSMLPPLRLTPYGSFPLWRLVVSGATLLALLFLLLHGFGAGVRGKQNVWATTAVGVLLWGGIGIAGCGGGGGSSAAAPQPAIVVTPSGTYTIVVTPTATSSATSKQFPLSPVSLTLIVK